MITQQLLQQYFNGTCTDEEKQMIATWLRDDAAGHPELFAMMNEDWELETDPQAGAELKGPLLQELRGRLYVPAKPKRVIWLWPAAAAAVAVLILVTGLFRSGIISRNSLATHWDTITNNTAYKQHILLPDSTGVWLVPGSYIAYTTTEKGAREVSLEGQAFFDVARDDARPFIVHTGHMQTRVLGTAFNIEAYRAEREIKVSLVQGRVAVADSARLLGILEAGHLLVYQKKDGSISRESLKLTDMNTWKSAGIIFNQVTVKDALQRLAQQYGLTIRYAAGLKLDGKFSTVFGRETPEQMIQNMLFITDHHFRIQGREVFITQ